MAFRRPKSASHATSRWREFYAAHRDLFEASGLPGAVRDERVFMEFAEEGFLPGDLHGPLPPIDVDDLDAAQREATKRLLELYADEFRDGSEGGMSALSAIRARSGEDPLADRES